MVRNVPTSCALVQELRSRYKDLELSRLLEYTHSGVPTRICEYYLDRKYSHDQNLLMAALIWIRLAFFRRNFALAHIQHPELPFAAAPLDCTGLKPSSFFNIPG